MAKLNTNISRSTRSSSRDAQPAPSATASKPARKPRGKPVKTTQLSQVVEDVEQAEPNMNIPPAQTAAGSVATAALVLQSDEHALADIDAMILEEALPELQESAELILKQFTTDSSFAGFQMMLNDLRTATSLVSKRLRVLDPRFRAAKAHYGADPFINVEAVHQKLSSEPHDTTPNTVLYFANIATLVSGMLGCDHENDATRHFLSRLDECFPHDFIPPLYNLDGRQAAVQGAPREATFDLALRLRIQLAIEQLRYGQQFGQDPYEMLVNTFFSPPQVRNDALPVFEDYETNGLLQPLGGIDLQRSERHHAKTQAELRTLHDSLNAADGPLATGDVAAFRDLQESCHTWAMARRGELHAALNPEGNNLSSNFTDTSNGLPTKPAPKRRRVSEKPPRAPKVGNKGNKKQSRASGPSGQVPDAGAVDGNLSAVNPAGTFGTREDAHAAIELEKLRKNAANATSTARFLDRQPGAQREQWTEDDSQSQGQFKNPLADPSMSEDEGFQNDGRMSVRPTGHSQKRSYDEAYSTTDDMAQLLADVARTTAAQEGFEPEASSRPVAQMTDHMQADDQFDSNAPAGTYGDVNQMAKDIAEETRRRGDVQEGQSRTRWGLADAQTLLDAIAVYGSGWSAIAKNCSWDRKSSDGPKFQVALKDKARNMKADYLKAGAELPAGFDAVKLSKKEIAAVRKSGNNPYRLVGQAVGEETFDMQGEPLHGGIEEGQEQQMPEPME